MQLSGLLFALLAVFVASFGARDQTLVIELGRAQGRRPLRLAVAMLATACSTALAVWAGAQLLVTLAPKARALFGVMALVAAGAEMLVLGRRRAPQEPTHSLFAAWLVLMALQITDAARFLALALAVGTAAPVPVGVGAAAGAMAALGLGWLVPGLVTGPLLGRLRRGAGAILLLIGLLVGWSILIG